MIHCRLLVTIALLSYPNLSWAREIDRKIVFKPGRTVATITGRIPAPDDVIVYEFNAQAGQRIRILLKPGGKLIAQAVLVLPSGRQEGPGAELTHVVKESGVFYVRVIPREQSWGSFRLSVSLR